MAIPHKTDPFSLLFSHVKRPAEIKVEETSKRRRKRG
jgi:hypothetical protein